MTSYKKLLQDFNDRGIPIDSPDFYDHPNFIEAEKINPSYLQNYAAFVASRPYTEEYLLKARDTITNAATVLYEHLKENGRQGACVDITGILARILEKHGIWCASIKGSCTIEFPPESKEDKTYFWSADHGQFAAGHAWLFAPPFNIVDITIGEQTYSGDKKSYIPKIILEENGINSKVEIEDVISPTALIELRMHRVPRDQYLNVSARDMVDVQKNFPVKVVKGLKGATIKYCPVAIHASIEPLEDMRNMDFNGKTPFELYEKFIKDNL